MIIKIVETVFFLKKITEIAKIKQMTQNFMKVENKFQANLTI